MEKYSDKTILNGIRQRKNSTLEYIYKEYFPQVQRMVLKHGGGEQDARDLFQEGLILIFNRLVKEELKIKSSFHNYFIVLCRFIWFRQNNIRHDSAYKSDEDETGETDDTVAGILPDTDRGAVKDGDVNTDVVEEGISDKEYSEYLENQNEKIFQRHYRKLPGDCKRVIKMFLRKKTFREIAKRMNYTSDDYGRRKKYLCMQQLMKMVSEDPEYIELRKRNRLRQQ